MQKLTANIEKLASNLKTNHDNKECVRTFVGIVYHDGELRCAVDCRFYMGRSSNASTVYCDLWIRAREVYGSGNGSAGGYGYDKYSAALDEAIQACGIQLSQSISGTGECEKAISAILTALGFSTFQVFQV